MTSLATFSSNDFPINWPFLYRSQIAEEVVLVACRVFAPGAKMASLRAGVQKDALSHAQLQILTPKLQPVREKKGNTNEKASSLMVKHLRDSFSFVKQGSRVQVKQCPDTFFFLFDYNRRQRKTKA